MWDATFYITIIISIITGVLANLLTPKVQDWLTNTSISRTSNRIKTIKSELDSIKYYHAHLDKLYLRSAKVGFSILYFIVLGTICSSIVPTLIIPFGGSFFSSILYTAALLFSLIPYMMAATAALNQVRLITRVDRIDAFTKSMNVKLKTLEAKTPARIKLAA